MQEFYHKPNGYIGHRSFLPFVTYFCMCSFVDIIYPLVYTAGEILDSYIFTVSLGCFLL